MDREADEARSLVAQSTPITEEGGCGGGGDGGKGEGGSAPEL